MPLYLADVVVAASSFEPRDSGLAITGFVINMAKVFEDFVRATLGEQPRALGGTTQTQDPWHLDAAGAVAMRPDLVWYADGVRPAAVIDAKYKAERPEASRMPTSTKLLAYCTALRLPVGHLIYAKGNDAGRTHEIIQASKKIKAHTLDLGKEPARKFSDVAALAADIGRAPSKRLT